MIDMKNLDAYELIEARSIDDVHAFGYSLRHKKSGARIAVLSNDDENKVFCIGFRTPPADDTGVAHILEHSVLCGSKHFPAKDPFVELVKGSMNTFLNAMTYPDKTVYPVASCNDQDFQNLMHVYLDAVFLTNIYDREEIFRQEGWHYELEEESGELTYNGVVYNEMKGAYSSPDGVLERRNMNSLFPDTPYGRESGGDPAAIPTLKYSDFLGFHSKYYHPSNSYIYLYGDMDVEEKLRFIDGEYLSKYDAMYIPSEVALQKPFDRMHEVTAQYSITSEEPEEENTYLSYNKVIGTSGDMQLAGAFQVLEYVLLSAPGAPLSKTLLDKGIGKDVSGFYDGSTQQPIFTVTSKNAEADQKAAFVETIEEVLRTVVKEGLDRTALEAAINYYEFRYREADYGTYSAGLMYGLDMYNTWLYDDTKPFAAIELLSVYDFLKQQIGTGYFEDLIRKYLLDNTHGSVVVVEPKRGLTAETDQKLRDELAAYKASLSKEEIAEIIASTKALKAYQQEPSTKEELETIPLLTRADMRTNVIPPKTEERMTEDVRVLVHDYFTNGIAYGKLLFDLSGVPEELFGYLGLLKATLGLVDTEHYSYGELFNEINRSTGGITCSIDMMSKIPSQTAYQWYFTVKSKALYDRQPVVFDMLREILLTSKLDDTKRLYEIVAQQKSSMQMYILGSGHSAAVGRASSYFSPMAYINDCTGGVAYYEFLKELEANFDERRETLVASLRRLMKLIFCKENLLADYTGEEAGYGAFADGTKALADMFDTEPVPEEKPFVFVPKKRNEGLRTSSKVQYVAVAGNYRRENLEYDGALRVLRVIMGYDYLWNHIRVLGGAYGCMNSYGKNGDSYFVSYRDPNLKKTFSVYENAVPYLERFDVDEREMTKYIIGTLSDMDAPLTPSMKGGRSLACYLTGQTAESLQKERDEVLNVTPEKIRALAKWVRAILDESCVCVIGSEESINANKELFDEIRTL